MVFVLLAEKGWIYGILFLEGYRPPLPPPVLLLEENPVSEQPSPWLLLEGSVLLLEDL